MTGMDLMKVLKSILGIPVRVSSEEIKKNGAVDSYFILFRKATALHFMAILNCVVPLFDTTASLSLFWHVLVTISCYIKGTGI